MNKLERLSSIRGLVDEWSVRLTPGVVVWAAGLLWLSNVNWKIPTSFGESDRGCAGLCRFVNEGVEHPVVPGSGWLLDHVIQPQLGWFGWTVLFAEASLAALLISRRHLRVAAVIGIAQSLAIGATVANAPHEWYWAYVLMAAMHVAVLGYARDLQPLRPKTMAVVAALYGVVVSVAHAEAGFGGDANQTWTLFSGSNDIPDEFGRGVFPGSLALGLIFVAVGVGAWVVSNAAIRVRVSAGWSLVGIAALLLLTYRNDGLAIGLDTKATTAVILAAVGLSLNSPRTD